MSNLGNLEKSETVRRQPNACLLALARRWPARAMHRPSHDLRMAIQLDLKQAYALQKNPILEKRSMNTPPVEWC